MSRMAPDDSQEARLLAQLAQLAGSTVPAEREVTRLHGRVLGRRERRRRAVWPVALVALGFGGLAYAFVGTQSPTFFPVPAPSSTLPLPPPPAGRAPDPEQRVVDAPALDGASVANEGEAASLVMAAPARERTGEVDATHGGSVVARSGSGSRLVEASWDQVNAALRRGDRALAEELLERLAARPGEGDAARLSLAQLRFGRGDSAGAKRLVEVLSRSSADPVVRERALSLLMKIEMARAAAP